ncbi:uncharacterized protein LOC118738714 [Rhagoletis pomonella]|uniref:uncharacterized protein LOC118738714 n=1 Tax=Rhagoletis pomonella TaxID=28610 RepID=UPI0017850F26|nr:uncharacterized protein LOC118738714 [Rhagoletis pomonella]
MERKQMPNESFDEFYSEIHNMTFRLRKKIPEKEMVGIIRGNIKSYIANLTFASKMETLAELKAECKRAEKVIKENRSRARAINELEVEPVEQIGENRVEAFDRNQTSRKPQHVVPVKVCDGTSASTSICPNTSKSTVKSFCPSPFHLMLCFACGMPVDHFAKNPAEAQKETKCKSSFHNMVCFACGSDSSFCVFKNNKGNSKLAEITGVFSQEMGNPEVKK